MHPERSPMDELEVIERLAAGDEDAAAELYRRTRPAVLDLLARRLGNWEEAEALAQEALLRTLDAGRRGPLRSFRAFALRVASNLATDQLRRRRFEWARGGDPDQLVAPSVGDDGPELDRLRSALAELPDDAREVVELRYSHGLSFAEIATRLSMSKNGVFARHERALALLRDRFATRRN